MTHSLKALLPALCLHSLRRLRVSIYKFFLKKFIFEKQFLQLNYESKELNEFDFNFDRASNYYSPLPVQCDLLRHEQRWRKPSPLVGVDYDIDFMKVSLSELSQDFASEFSALPNYAEKEKLGFGAGYTPSDAFALYCNLRKLRPSRYIEVGSGLSTHYASLAAEKNAQEQKKMQMTCIEPNVYPKLREINGIELIEAEVQDVPLDRFAQLESGDVLFIDSSHVLKIDSDVTYLYLEVLPQLKKGVHIHLHDISFPYNVPYPIDYWVLKRQRPMYWNEAMLVQAFLCYNDRFRISLSLPLIRHHDEAFLHQWIPNYQDPQQNPNACSSLWIERVA